MLESKPTNRRKGRPQRLRKLVDVENDLRVLKVKISSQKVNNREWASLMVKEVPRAKV
jgi:hypothetical protein